MLPQAPRNKRGVRDAYLGVMMRFSSQRFRGVDTSLQFIGAYVRFLCRNINSQILVSKCRWALSQTPIVLSAEATSHSAGQDLLICQTIMRKQQSRLDHPNS